MKILIVILLCLGCSVCFAQQEIDSFVTKASWYSVASCKREGTWQKYNGRMANGKIFDDDKSICASWDYPFGTNLKVTNISTGKTVEVRVSDKGPSKKLYRLGRKLDLSKAAFAQIANLEQGVINVKVEQVR